jgi:hypothetical protein
MHITHWLNVFSPSIGRYAIKEDLLGGYVLLSDAWNDWRERQGTTNAGVRMLHTPLWKDHTPNTAGSQAVAVHKSIGVFELSLKACRVL